MKKFNQSTLPYIAAVVQAIMFSYVGVQYFGAWGWVIGPGVGAVVSLSLTVASSRISDIAQKRQPLARAMYYILFVLSPATIALTLYMPESPFTAIAWAAAPDVAIGLAGSVAGGSLIARNETATPKQETATVTRKQGKARKASTKVARKAITDSDLIVYLQANEGASQQQVAEHFGVSRQAIGQRVKKLFEVKQ